MLNTITLRLTAVLALALSFMGLTGCEELLTDQPTRTVNRQITTYHFDSDYDDFGYHRNQLHRERNARYYQEERARLQRETYEHRMALERTRNAAERARLQREIQARAQQANQLRRAEAEGRARAAAGQANAQRELNAERERRHRAEQGQIAADRGLAERLQADENARFQRENANRMQRDQQAAVQQQAREVQIANDRAFAERLQQEEIQRYQQQQAVQAMPDAAPVQNVMPDAAPVMPDAAP